MSTCTSCGATSKSLVEGVYICDYCGSKTFEEKPVEKEAVLKSQVYKGNHMTINANNAIIKGNYNKVIGNGNLIKENHCKVIGDNNEAKGNYIKFMGKNNTAKGNYISYNK